MTEITTSASNASSSSSPSPFMSSRSWKYDVFLSFRGEDTRKTFVDHLYYALQRRLISTYKDDERLPRGDTIGPSLINAIADSKIALVIFSENYANSSWCLDELTYIMKCRKEREQIVMPIFYHVDPSDVRKQKGEFGKAFAKHQSENTKKIESWRKALMDASNIAGWETKHIANGHEAKGIEDIVGIILDKFLSFNSVVDKNLVGMGTRLQDLKSQLQIGSDGVHMIGIWGIGGGGKTTLAFSLFMEIRDNFHSSCFVEDIKEESNKHGMKSLQEQILSTVFDRKVKVQSVDLGKQMIKDMLCRRKVLIVLDDVDDRKHLDALAGSHDWFGDGSRIVITTRNEHLLKTHKVKEVYNVSLLSDEEAIRLFNSRAYDENNPVDDYEKLSQHVVSYAAGLPLAIIVLGSFLYDKDNDEWISTLDRLKGNPEMEIVEKLKISYDGLKPKEKELFLDIACFCRGMEKGEAMVMLDACGFHPIIGFKVLSQKGLISIKSVDRYRRGKRDIIDMHDLLQETGHYIVREKHPDNPEKHSRLWRFEQIKDMCSGNETMEKYKTEAIVSYHYPSNFHKLVSMAKKLRLISMHNFDKKDFQVPEYISNELRYMYFESNLASPFPESFEPRKLVVLRLKGNKQKELWTGNKSLPCLKELQIRDARNLVRTPDLVGLPCLQNLTLMYCGNLKEFPKIEANMDSLVNISLVQVGIEVLPSSVGKYCTNLKVLNLESCNRLKSIEGNFNALKLLQKCEISGEDNIMLPKDLFNENNCLEDLYLFSTRPLSIPHSPRFLKRLRLGECGLEDGEIPCDIGELSNLQELDLSDNEFSRLNFSLLQLSQLKLLNLERCEWLVELPKLPINIAILKADDCRSLEVVGDIHTNCKWLCKVSITGRTGNIVSDGDTLLQSMLQGHAIENGCMRLQLKGTGIPNELIPPLLLQGSIFRLQLVENWYNHFSGFLICVVFGILERFSPYISMKHMNGGSTSMDSEHDVFWEESCYGVYDETWFGYVSFGSLKDTLWWDPTSNAIEFSIQDTLWSVSNRSCSGFGVSLVPKRSESGQLETTRDSSEYSDDYTCKFSIEQDSKSELKCLFD